MLDLTAAPAQTAPAPARALAPLWSALPPAAAIAASPLLPPWAFMWLFGFAIFLAFKLATLRRLAHPVPFIHVLAYCLLWVGMDADRFFRRPAASPAAREWLAAILKSLIGAALVWVAARFAYPLHPLLGGWTAILGIGFILHFGGFHLLAVAWRAAGFDAVHIMNSPLLARSVADFWSARWNLAFRRLAHDFVFIPAARRHGARVAELAAFLFSGLLHEMVITVPARAGYGLPTAYFLVQGLGAAFERSPGGRALGLRGGWRGRLFAWFVTGCPAFILFHPPFIERVVNPFLRAIGAL